MHLIDEVQDDPDTLVIDANALPQVSDQPGAGRIHLGQDQPRVVPLRDKPALINPDPQGSALNPDL